MTARRGLSTVVGMVFSIIALTSTVAYVSYSMNTLSNYNQSVITNNQQNTNMINEKFQVSSATIVNGKFNITVANTGNIPINFTKIWIQNTTATDWTHSYVPVNKFVSPGGILKNLGQSIPVSALPTMSYNIKLVTSRGNSYQFYMNSVNKAPISLQLISSPGSVPTGFTTTILMTVLNNMTNSAILTNISPNPLSVVSNNGITSNCGPVSPSSYAVVPIGATVIFQWTCTESGTVGTAITYNATLQNGFNHNYALATVSIGNVLFSAQSASSVSAQGLNPIPVSNSLLLFDQNQYSVPYGGYQMYNTQVNNSTNTFLSLDSLGGVSFFTNNGTALTISPGKWNATLRYISSPVPVGNFTGSQYPDVIFHFEDYVASKNNIGNSAANHANMTTTGSPTWSATSGVNSTGSYTFSGSGQYMAANVAGGYTNIPSGTTKINTAMWLKTSASCAGTCTILRIGDANNTPFYMMYISGHTLIFKFSDNNNGVVDVTCTGTKTIDDQQWHYIVAEKTGGASCSTYVDGTLDVSNTGSNPCAGPGCGPMGGHFDLGRDQAAGGNYFAGTIDDFMHWNGNWNNNLSLTQIKDLMKTSYGSNAYSMTFNIFQTDSSGNCASGNGGLNGNCNNIISQAVNVQLPFQDGWYTGYTNPSPSASIWGHYNYTVNPGQVSFTSSQRLDFQAKLATQARGQLGMKMIIDNTALSDSWGQSQLQTPAVTTPFLGYYEYMANTCNGNPGGGGMTNNQVGQVYVYNAGPDISWVSQGSRAIFMTLDKSSGYASWIYFTTGAGSSSSKTDSVAAPVGNSTLLYYSTPYTQPGLQTSQKGTLIPPGYYKMYVYLNGYDEEGHSLLSTDYMGVVRVYYTNNPPC